MLAMSLIRAASCTSTMALLKLSRRMKMSTGRAPYLLGVIKRGSPLQGFGFQCAQMWTYFDTTCWEIRDAN